MFVTLPRTERPHELESIRIATGRRTNTTRLFRAFVRALLIKITHELKFCFVFIRLVDNLPAATPVINPETNDMLYEHGYRLGKTVGDAVYINNHLKLTLLYHNPTP